MKKLVSVVVAAVALFGLASTAQADVKTYKMACAACHAFGPGPKLGNKADWKARIAQGMPTLVKHAIKGTAKGMPPKGGRMDLSDAQVTSAVKYMVDSSK